MIRVDQPHCVYRLYDTGGHLLYVGLSVDPPRRWTQHHRRAWWSQVARTTTEWHPGRRAALLAEKAAIHSEHPLHNVRHRSSCP